MKILSGKNVLFATFSMWSDGKRMPTNGNVEPFRDFLLKHVNKLILIDQPVPSSSTVVPQIEIYKKNSKKFIAVKPGFWLKAIQPLLRASNKHGTRMIFKIRDFLSVFDMGLRENKKIDYLVGIEAVNCAAGIFLRSLGKVDKVIYYVLDYSPNRFSSEILNKFYLALDRYCIKHSDYVWDVSPEFQKFRIKNGLEKKYSNKIIRVPIGLYKYQIFSTPKMFNKGSANLVFVGSLGEENGPDLAIETLKLVLKKYPNALLHVVGGGDDRLERLKVLAKKMNVYSKVKFYGFIPSIREMVNLINKFDIALAPYREFDGSIRYYADSAKTRTYAGAGLPIVTTPVPPLGLEMEKLGGAVVAHDNPKDFARAVDKVLSDKELYNSMAKAVTKFAKDNTWDNEFKKAFSKMD